MLAPNIARLVEGELDREVRGNVVAHPLTSRVLGLAVSNSTRPETHSGPLVSPWTFFPELRSSDNEVGEGPLRLVIVPLQDP